MLDERDVEWIIEIDFVILDEAPRLIRPGEVEAVPVDDRTPAQNQPQRLDIVQREIIDGLQPRRGKGARGDLARPRRVGFEGLCQVAAGGWAGLSDAQ